MAFVAGGDIAVVCQLLADGCRSPNVGFEGFDIGQGRWGRYAQYVFQYPYAAHHGRCFDPVGGCGQYAGVSEQAAAVGVVKFYFAKFPALYAFYAV